LFCEDNPCPIIIFKVRPWIGIGTYPIVNRFGGKFLPRVMPRCLV
jgi:hypothetical protein